MIRVGVFGAAGRMGAEVCRAVDADPDLELVAAVDVAASGEVAGVAVSESADALTDAGATVAVDFTHPDAVLGNIRWCLAHDVHAVVGTTGIEPAALDALRGEAETSRANVVIAPNFAIGAVLLLRFAAQAARYLPDAEVIELHHPGKADAPSGTALTTARVIAGERGSTPVAADGAAGHSGARGADIDGVRVHSVRLPGLVAHEEVVFGGPGQILTIRHDSTDRTSFMPGVLLAIRHVADRPGLTVGLDALL